MTDDPKTLWRRYDAWWDSLSSEDRKHVEKCCASGQTDNRLRVLIVEHDGPSKAAFEVGNELTTNETKYCAIPSALVEFVESKR